MRTELRLGVQKIMVPWKSKKFSLRILTVKPFAKKQKWQLPLSEVSLMVFLCWKLHHEVGYYRNKHYGINLKQMSVVISEK